MECAEDLEKVVSTFFETYVLGSVITKFVEGE